MAKAGVAQEHVLAISPGPAAEDPIRYAVATLALAVGDDSGSRFYWELIDPGLVESASCSVDQNQAAGVIVSSFSCDPKDAAENLAIMKAVLAEVQQNGITAEELAMAAGPRSSTYSRRRVRGVLPRSRW